MLRFIKSAGLTSWPKIFANLRSTLRTELRDAFTGYVVDAGLGHSTRVAEKHYLQVTTPHNELGLTRTTGEMTKSLQ